MNFVVQINKDGPLRNSNQLGDPGRMRKILFLFFFEISVVPYLVTSDWSFHVYKQVDRRLLEVLPMARVPRYT